MTKGSARQLVSIWNITTDGPLLNIHREIDQISADITSPVN